MANDLTAFIPQVWSKRVIQKLDQINVMLPLCNRDYEGEIRAQGDTVWVRTYGNVALTPYSRGGPIQYGPLVPTKESLVIADASNFAISVDDLDEVQNDLNALDGYAQRAAVALNNAVEGKILSTYATCITANQDSNSGSAYTIDSTNAYARIVNAGQLLDQQNAPLEGRYIVVTPAYKASLLQDAKYFIRATEMGDTIVKEGNLGSGTRRPGFIGTCAGFDVYCSNATPKDSGGRYCPFGVSQSIAYAGQLRKIETIRRETTWATAVRGLLLHDATVFAERQKAVGYIYVAS